MEEDSPDNRTITVAFLKDTPYKVEIAENGAVAYEKFIAGHYDLVLMDRQMPVMDGLTATRAIRQWELANQRPPTPIIALTASALFTNACAAPQEAKDPTLERMAAEHEHDEPVPAAAAALPAAEGVLTQEVVYGHEDGKPLKGFIAWPDAAENAPSAVMLIHEWWGLNDNMREMARKLAAEGYVALAAQILLVAVVTAGASRHTVNQTLESV